MSSAVRVVAAPTYRIALSAEPSLRAVLGSASGGAGDGVCGRVCVGRRAMVARRRLNFRFMSARVSSRSGERPVVHGNDEIVANDKTKNENEKVWGLRRRSFLRALGPGACEKRRGYRTRPVSARSPREGSARRLRRNGG